MINSNSWLRIQTTTLLRFASSRTIAFIFRHCNKEDKAYIFYIKTSISWYDWVSLCTSIYWKHVQEIKQQLCRIVHDTPRPRTVDWLHIVSSWRNNFQKTTIQVSYFSLDGAAAAVWLENIRDFISKSLSELVIRL